MSMVSGIFTGIILLSILGIGYLFMTEFLNAIKERGDKYSALEESLSKYQKDSILENYQNFSYEFQNIQGENEPLTRAWNQYEKTLVKITEAGRQQVYATVDAAVYINGTLTTAGLNNVWWKNVAGVFTGLGILGTFLGLTLGLSGIDAQNTENIQKGIESMLGGMNTAFVTSILGIICAIGSNWFASKYVAAASVPVERIAAKLNELFVVKNVEQLLSEITDENRKQTNELQTFNTDLAIKIGDAFTECIESSLPQLMEESIGPMISQLNSTMKNIDESLQGLNGAIEHLNNGGTKVVAEKMAESMGNEMQNFASVLGAIPAIMQKTMDDAKKTSEESNALLKDSVTIMMDRMSEQLNNTINEQQAVSNQMNEKFAALMQEMENNSRQASAEMQRSIEDGRQASKDISAEITNMLSDNMNNVSLMMNAQLKTVEESMAKQNEAMSQFGKQMGEELQKTASTVSDDLKEQTAALALAVTTINGIVDKSESVMTAAKDAAEHFEGAADPIHSCVKTLNETVNKNIEECRNAAQKMANAGDSFSNTVSEAMENIKEIMSGSSELVEKTAEYQAKMNEHDEAVKILVKDCTLQLDGLGKDLEDAFERMNKGVNEYTESLNESLKGNLGAFDTSVARAFSNLSSYAEQMDEKLEDLTDAAEAFKNALVSLRRNN